MWLSPPGCLQFSLLLDLPASLSSKMVFIQYIMALAVCEAVDEDGRLGVRIKWPNDIYAEVEGVGGTEIGSGKKGKVKLGGILVNTSYVGGKWRIVVGKFFLHLFPNLFDPALTACFYRMWYQRSQRSSYIVHLPTSLVTRRQTFFHVI